MYYSILGGEAVWSLAISAFIADITSPEERAIRYAIVHLAANLGEPIAPILANQLYLKGIFMIYKIANCF